MNDPTPQPALSPSEAVAAAQLRQVRRLIREQLAGAVIEERLDIDLDNDILDTVGLPNLPRIWKVRIGLVFVCEATAASNDEAFDAAENAIEAAVAHAGIPVDIDWQSPERDEAIPGPIDHHALAAVGDTGDGSPGPEPDPTGSGGLDAPDSPREEWSGRP